MAIKDTPTNVKTYYQLMIKRTSKLLDEIKKEKEVLENKREVSRKEIEKNINIYREQFKLNLDKYEEYKTNIYITGELHRIAKSLFINRNNNYEFTSNLFELYKYAKLQKDIHTIDKTINLYNKLLKLKVTEYTDILRTYYNEVHKQLIINGNGYAFGENIGWICVNRIILRNPKAKLDYAATKKKEKELKEQGKRIWNKDEADWCLRNGIEYKAEDKRVFKKDEYCYEIPLIHCKLPNGTKLKLDISDYRHKSVRGKTNDDLIKLCNSDLNKICELRIDLKTKLTLCDKADKILYTKFIRNENQKSIAAPKISSKNRQ